MYHSIEFTAELTVGVEVSSKQPLERLRIERGTRVRAQVKPYVVNSSGGPIEVADLFFQDGTATRKVPFAFFSFVE
jgi:hypothetical protein